MPNLKYLQAQRRIVRQNLNLTNRSINDNVESDSNSRKSDDTNSEIYEETRLSNSRFNSHRKSQNLECRDLFTIEIKDKQQHGICSYCKEVIKTSSNSDGNQRTHLCYKHGKVKFLTKHSLKYGTKENIQLMKR